MSLEYIHPTVQIRYEEAGGWVTGMPSLGLTIAPTSKPDYSKLLSGQDDGPVYTMLSCLPKSVVKKCSLIHPPSDCTPKPAFSTNNHQESLAKKSTRHNSSSNGRHEALWSIKPDFLRFGRELSVLHVTMANYPCKFVIIVDPWLSYTLLFHSFAFSIELICWVT